MRVPLTRYWKTIVPLALAGSIWFLHAGARSQSGTALTEPVMPVEVHEAIAMNLPVQLRAMGELVAHRQVEIVPEVAGHVATVCSEEGGVPVHQGTVVVQLDDLATRSRLASAKAALAYSQADFHRKETLARSGAISRQVLEQALSDLRAREADVQSIQHDLDGLRLVAPFDGVLGQMNIAQGQYVTAGQKLVTLTDIRHVRVQYSVPERYFSVLQTGQPVTVSTSAWPGKTFTGKVTFVSPTVNPHDRTIMLHADVPNDAGHLTAGLFVDVQQTLRMMPNALVVVPASLTSTLQGKVIYRIREGLAERIPVTVISRNTEFVQIQGSIVPGDLVVVAGQERLHDGSRVEVVKTS